MALRVLLNVSRLNWTPLAARSIFNESFLQLDRIRIAKNKGKLQISQPEKLKENIKTNLSNSHVQKIFSQDVKQLMSLASSEDDLNLIGEVIKAKLEDGVNHPKELERRISNFFALCSIFNSVSFASDLWNSAELERNSAYKSRMTQVRYLQLLYDNDLHVEVADFATSDCDDEANFSTNLLIMASLAKMGTKEAFEKAKVVMKKDNFKSLRRIGLYSYLATKCGHHAFAFDLIDHFKSDLAANLKLWILIEADRIDEALEFIRESCLDKPQISFVCLNLMEELADVIRKTHGNSSETAKDFTDLCLKLENAVSMSEKTVEDLLFSRISSKEQSN